MRLLMFVYSTAQTSVGNSAADSINRLSLQSITSHAARGMQCLASHWCNTAPTRWEFSDAYVAHPVWHVTTHRGVLTARRLVITFVPTTVDQARPFSVMVRTNARPPRRRCADAECSVASTFAAAGGCHPLGVRWPGRGCESQQTTLRTSRWLRRVFGHDIRGNSVRHRLSDPEVTHKLGPPVRHLGSPPRNCPGGICAWGHGAGIR
jgi:hypothetical protein